MSGAIHVFGVRHLSPAGAWHLRAFLDRVRPKVVLVEGLADADELISDLVHRHTRPPVAILAYTDVMPVRTLVYPLARYCPEYQALLWAQEHDARAAFIDLPSDVFLAFADAEASAAHEAVAADDTSPAAVDAPARPLGPERYVSLYDRYAQRAGEDDYESYWERRFEHNLADDGYRLAAFEFGRGMRDLAEDAPRWRAENLVREAYMRRQIRATLATGVRPDEIVAVVGAFHASVLGDELPAMSDAELAALPRRGSRLTLMPYSYNRLSSQSGYGAGNPAPSYFEQVWDALVAGDLPGLPARYLSRVARHVRAAGTHRSTAEVIEGVRLARTLSALKGGQAPTLRDLRDAAVTLIGHGERALVRDALVLVEVGTEIGRLREGAVRTSIQADFERELERLRLAKYRTAVPAELALDLRENRHATTPAAAFLDLARSAFLHRLGVLGIAFATPTPAKQRSATWAERWTLAWTPESEIALVEAVLLGETVELAAAYRFKTRLATTTGVGAAAELVREACECALMPAMELARLRLAELAADSAEFVPVAHAAHQLSLVVRYGDVRRFDPTPLMPLIEELFVRGALALDGAAHCDTAAARAAIGAIDELNHVALEHSERVDETLWLARLRALATSDARNPLMSGYACAMLLERGLLANDELAREVSRRLSPGVDADLGAGWFEGLARRNRHALLARQPLWEELARYVASLDEDEFRRALVFLRRAFGPFGPREKRHVAENLGHAWGIDLDSASELLEKPLSDDERAAVDALNEFDFGDL